MVKNNGEFSGFDLAKMMRQPETQALLARLQQMDGDTLRQAAQKAQSGDTEGARDLLTPLLQDSEVQKLANQVRDSNGGIR